MEGKQFIGEIQFQNVSKNYGQFKALDSINLTIKEGTIFGLVGKSGAGKSTLLRTINKLEEIDDGKIIVGGNDVSLLKGKELREFRKNVGMIFQNFSLLEMRSIYDNIALPLECNHESKDEINKTVLRLAKIVGLTDQLDKRPKQLSGGQKQRVAIARALALNPKILLCDEATSALDPVTTQSILDLLKDINKNLGITIVIVTHQMEVVKAACQEIAIIENGVLIEKGKTEALFLSSNKALKNLINEDEILPESGINIRLYFSKNSEDAVITKIARTLDIDFGICWGKLEKFQDNVLGSLIINIKEDDEKKVTDFLKTISSINWEVL